MSLRSNLKLKRTEITAIVVNIGAMWGKELAGCTQIWRLLCCFKQLPTLKLLVLSDFKESWLLSGSHYPLATSLQPTQSQHEFLSLSFIVWKIRLKKLGHECFLGLQSHSPSHCSELHGPFSYAKSGPGLPGDQVGARHSSYISAEVNALKQVHGHVSILFKWIWGAFIKCISSLESILWLNSLYRVAIYQHYPCSAH